MQQLSQSPTEPAFVQDPYPFYARARAAGDLVYWQDYDMVCATSHAAVQQLLRDRRFGRECPAEMAAPIPAHLEAFYKVEAHSMLELEPPRHTRLRALVLRAFTSRRIASMEAEIETLCHRLVDSFPDEAFDLIDAYAQPVPIIVICRLLGVPEQMAPQLLAWSNAMVAMYQARRDREIEDAANAAAQEFSDFLSAYITRRKATPGDDLISHLISAEADGTRLSRAELITTCILLLNAGHEATVHSLGNGIAGLLLRGEVPSPGQETQVAEEVLRHDPPLHMFTRYAYEDVTLFGHRFRRGDRVGLLLASANRDETVFHAAERFDPTRAIPAQSSFGGGLHFCVGAPLARLEMQVAFRVLFQRCPALRLAATPEYANLYHFHGLTRLRVRTR